MANNSSETKKRIQGYDVARALAVFIMVIVNFDLVLAQPVDSGALFSFLNILKGKGAALFIVLAGIGISLMTKTNLAYNDKIRLQKKRKLLFKRSVFLFVFGLAYFPLWPADILHYYGLYISIGVLVMSVRSIYLWVTALSLIMVYPFILGLIDYEQGWNWIINEYTNFWTFKGFFRNLFVNGFHPVIPWVAFILVGMWFGRQNINDKNRRSIILWFSVTLFILVQMSSYLLIDATILYTNLSVEDAFATYGTKPMPPMPLFMLSGISWSFTIIILCIWITEKFNNKNTLSFLASTGQMAFTHYILHVVVGVLSAYLLFGENNLSPLAVFFYALVFCCALIVVSVFWRKHFKRGPMSLLMRFITG